MTQREKIISIAQSYIGYKESDGSHKKIIDIYNSYKPLPQGYKVKYTDSWCATFVSVCGIAANLSNIIYPECSCPRMINLYKAQGLWQENDAYVPKTGDIILYDWQDNGIGDNQGTADHIGIVEKVENNIITVIEGNMNDAVSRRNIQVNGKYIRGYCCPNYTTDTVNNTQEEDVSSSINYKSYKGGYLYEIPLESIERIEYFKSNGNSGETVSNAAKRIQWNGRYPDIICNAELFNMKTYAPASAVVDEGKAQLLNGTSGFGFIDHKTPKFSYNNNINAVDFIGGYPVLIHNGAKAFTTDPAGLSGNRARTALGLNATKFSIAVVPESSNDATLSDMANLFIQNGYIDAIGLDGGGSTAYQTNEFSYEQGRKVRGFICVWYKGGKGNKASQSSSSVNPNPVTPTKNPPLKQDTSAKSGIKYTVKANGGLNIRDAQGTIITLLSNGSTVMWYGYYTEQYFIDGKWLYVKTSNGVTGYVSSKYLVR